MPTPPNTSTTPVTIQENLLQSIAGEADRLLEDSLHTGRSNQWRFVS